MHPRIRDLSSANATERASGGRGGGRGEAWKGEVEGDVEVEVVSEAALDQRERVAAERTGEAPAGGREDVEEGGAEGMTVVSGQGSARSPGPRNDRVERVVEAGVASGGRAKAATASRETGTQSTPRAFNVSRWAIVASSSWE